MMQHSITHSSVFLTRFGATYGCGTYGAGAYDEGQCTQTSAPNTGYGPAEFLSSNEGSLLLGVTGGLLILAAVVLIVLRRRRR